VRIKYRPAAIQPEFTESKENVSLSVAKKVKPVPEDPYADIPKVSNDPIVFLASHTQIKRVEVLIASDEEVYRKKHYPTIEERVKQQKEWARLQLRDAKLKSEREAMKQQMEKQALQARLQLEAVKANKKDGTPIPEDLDVTVDPMIPDNPATVGGLPLGEGPDEGADEDAMGEMNEEYMNEIMDIKEKKLLASKNNQIYHEQLSSWQIRKKTIAIQMGWLGKNNRDVSEVLPWLLLGRREISANITQLNKLNVTHILNMTKELPNAYPNSFLYERVPIKDNNDADIAAYFPKIVNFLRRVEKCKGRVLVHCTAGASRAPTAVMAYFVYMKGIPLVDAYYWIRMYRPLIMPNQRFLLDLAKLECDLGEGCSVYYDREWAFYDFNAYRGANPQRERRSFGTYQTVRALHQLYEEEIDPEA